MLSLKKQHRGTKITKIHSGAAPQTNEVLCRRVTDHIVALTVPYYNAAPMIQGLRGIDVFNKLEQAQRKEEVLKFIRYALFKNPEAADQ